jgi:hypothetical protein
MDLTRIASSAKEQASLTDSILSRINTMIIAQVTKVYAETQRVDVQPCITIKEENQNSKNYIYNWLGKRVPVSELEMPEILNVPLSFPRAGTFMLTLPVAVGDYGMLIFSSQDMQEWKTRGGTQVEQKSLDLLNINDCVFIPYVASDQDVVSDYNPDALELRAGDDKLTMAGDGKVSTNCDIEIDGISFKAHVHGKGSYKEHDSFSLLSGTSGVPE